jgi:hypothetical protein
MNTEVIELRLGNIKMKSDVLPKVESKILGPGKYELFGPIYPQLIPAIYEKEEVTGDFYFNYSELYYEKANTSIEENNSDNTIEEFIPEETFNYDSDSQESVELEEFLN